MMDGTRNHLDFWSRQDAARRASRWLVVLLLLAVVVVVGAIDAATAWLCQVGHLRDQDRSTILIITTLGTLGLVIGGAAWRFWQLREGGVAVALQLGGREIWRGAATEAERRLMAVVEEMAIASGLPVPRIYVLNEEGINACAAGYTPADAVICVTKGALDHLSRDELQGVVAHEFSHILNGDMTLNLRTLCLVHGLLVIGLTGRVLIETSLDGSHHTVSRRRDGEGSLGALGIGLALAILGFLGWIAGMLIRAAVCRQREHLADAHAVQFTRYPAGLAGALIKTLGLSRGSLLVSPASAEAAHLFFALPRREWWDIGISTHPPVQDRIRALDPAWDGRIPELVSWRPSNETPAVRPPVAAQAVAPARMAALVGTVPPAAVAFGASLRKHLPPALRNAASDSQEAQAACLAALLPAQDPAWGRITDPFLAHHGPRLAALLDTAGRERGRLTLIQLCLPALRRLTPAQAAALTGPVLAVAEADLAATVLARLVLVHLRPRQTSVVNYQAMTPLAADCAVLLGALAAAGSGDVQVAYEAAWRELLLPGAVRPRPAVDLAAVDAALARLRQANGAIKRRLVTACAQAVAADGRVDPAEAELLRLVCDSLDCPLPVFADDEAPQQRPMASTAPSPSGSSS